jgi:hypothetical protein
MQAMGRVAEHLQLEPSIAREFGIAVHPEVVPPWLAELNDFFRRYLNELMFALGQFDTTELPSDLASHFFGLWFMGGRWEAAPGRPPLVQACEHDGAVNPASESPIAILQHLERWAAWRAMDSLAARPRTSQYNSAQAIWDLRNQGMPTALIAAQLGITTQAVRMALGRHERRLAEKKAQEKTAPEVNSAP